MNIRQIFASAAISGTLALSQVGFAQDTTRPPSDASNGAIDRMDLFDSLEKPTIVKGRSQSESVAPAMADLRLARAIRRADERSARIERNLWLGVDPLRPQWTAIPMTQSRYAPRRVYVPVFVYGH
ncbi:hypothetical protein K227x_25620 [Rubripirellula lacrimiformis]|uniref:Uncharacterized protein n=1 Tax=Rubripirellula lacrimiformis TaxID=1930273 RepID=A0A517NAL3_9BACT|nr:hypothetical protein [Rubripirellula lacrimiformis]QDT04173.1 hypothetical protein K227x_25620 [Rubripirellula lacrimiformis]